MLRVGINGYGTIGKRVADAVRAQPDMEVCGVAKRRPDYGAVGAIDRGYPLYTIETEYAARFREIGIDVAGTVEELVRESDVIVDATPAGIGAENRPLYERHGTPALFQGGEDATVAEVSFNARANFEEAVDADYVRVVSCNTTGLSRVVAPLSETYGIETVRATLVRRGGDPDQTARGPINDVVPDPVTVPSHHGPDLQTVFPDLSVDTIGLKVPTTLMHVHAINVTLESEPDGASAIGDCFRTEDRLVLLPAYAGIDGAGKLQDLATDAGRPRGDVWENCIWGESITASGRDCYFLQAIHQQADVVPETVDAIRAVTGACSAPESTTLTNETLGIGFECLRERGELPLGRRAAD